MTLEEPVYIHPSSVLYHMNKEFIVYQLLEETSSRIYMKGNTACVCPAFENKKVNLVSYSILRTGTELTQSHDNQPTVTYSFTEQ